MPSTITDRLYGANSGVAVKAPVVAVALTNIVLKGLQTVGGVLVNAGDRVLVAGQTSPIDNGIYNVSASGWTRAGDFDGPYDVVNGTLVVQPIAAGNGALYQVNAANPVLPGSSPVTFALLANPNVTYPPSAAEIAAGVTPTNGSYPQLTPQRYGGIGDGAHPVQDAAAWAKWSQVMGVAASVASQWNVWSRVDPTCVGIGTSTLISLQLGAIQNTALGNAAGANITTGQANTCIGYSAAPAMTVGNFTTSVGANSLLFYTNGLGFNTVFGYGAMARSLTGSSNVAVGFEALHDNGAGTQNVAIGAGALHSGTNGVTPAPADPSSTVAIGAAALQNCYSSGIVAVGAQSGTVVTSAINCVFVGLQTALVLTTGNNNTYVGNQAGIAATTGSDTTLLGNQAGNALTTGGQNTFAGSLSGFNNTTQTACTYIGYQAGQGTLASNGGSGNVAIGTSAMGLCRATSSCTAVGNLSLRVVQAADNTAVGSLTLDAETTGIQNTAIGSQAGHSQTPGFNNTSSFGYQAFATASNQVTLGNPSVATLRCQVTTITALSDLRDKWDVQDLSLGLDYINQVQFRQFKRAHRDGSRETNTFEAGIIAQELRDLQQRTDTAWMELVLEADPERLEATPGKLLFPMGVAIQQISARLTALEARIH